MKFSHYIICIFILGIYISCNKTTPLTNTSEEHYKWMENSDIKISSYIDTIEYVALESHPEGLFKKIDKLIVRNGRIYILDYYGRNQVIVFDSIGNFLFTVGRKGRAPGEFIETRNFTVDDKNIYLVDNHLHNILVYDLNGNYRSTHKLPYDAFDMAVLSNGDYLFAWQKLEGTLEKEGFKVFVTNKKMEIKERGFPLNNVDCMKLSKTSFFTESDSTIVYHSLMSDTIYIFDRSSIGKYSKISFDFESFALPQIRDKYIEEYKHPYKCLYTTPFVTSKYIIGSILTRDGIDTYLFDRKKKVVIGSNALSEDPFFFFHPLFIYNNTVIAYLPYGMYKKCIEAGMCSASKEVEKRIDNDDYILIKYYLK